MCIALVFVITACNSKPAGIEKWSKAEIDKKCDSLKIKLLIAAYVEFNGYTLITKEDSSSNEATKRIYIPNFPVVLDTLIQLNKNEFKSKKQRTLHLVSDSAVVVTIFQKIIHPSSNWQGQTPWQEVNVFSYARLDRN